MQKFSWQAVLKGGVAPERIKHALHLLKQTEAGPGINSASPEEIRIWSQIFVGSNALTDLLVKHPAWLQSLTPALLTHPRQEQGLQREIQGWLQEALSKSDYEDALEKLREFKQKEMLRIGARDLARLGRLPELLLELSNVADVCLRTVYQVSIRQLQNRFGRPYYSDEPDQWEESSFCVLGLGKLGGQELNYSSDVDLLFVYREEGQVSKEHPGKVGPKSKTLTNHKFFQKLAENMIAELGRVSNYGFLFRVDMRLRPEGPSGPLVRSLNSYEHYYAQWGQSWERMMLIKTRAIAGDLALGSDFLEVIQPFRYPRFLSEGVLQEVAATKSRIEEEVVKAGELERNVKLGRGGIREIEFFVQTLQLLHAGRVPFLQSAQTLSTLDKLVQYNLLPSAEAERLKEAYGFLRDLEHRLQIDNNLQTHSLPIDRKARERLAGLMGFKSLALFESALAKHQQQVRKVYQELFAAREPDRQKLTLPPFSAEAEWASLLKDYSFKDLPTSLRLIQTFALGPGFGHVSARTTELARQLIAKFLDLCPTPAERPLPTAGGQLLSDPDRVLARLDSFIEAYGSRALLYETWLNYPTLFRLWLLLFDRSEYLAEVAIRTPDLVDDLVLSGRLRRQKDAEQILQELREGISDADQSLWLRRYHQVELMRIGLRDILGLADFEQNLLELSSLAAACLEYALEIVCREHSYPKPPCAIIGLGKLGGGELNYGSDLDLLFVAGPREKNLPRLQEVAAELMDLMSRQTAAGSTFTTDARLRPDGEKGLLVNTLVAYQEYYHHRAHLWEIQALTRARFIAGNPGIGKRFIALAGKLTNFQSPPASLSAFRPDWKAQIAGMRLRIEKERTPRGKERLAIKTGAGGLMDAEFLAQVVCLAEGWREPNTLLALQRAQEAKALPSGAADQVIHYYRQLRRIEGILRRWSFQGETFLPEDEAALGRVARRCGFTDTAAFMKHIEACRAAIRQVYAGYFASVKVMVNSARRKIE